MGRDDAGATATLARAVPGMTEAELTALFDAHYGAVLGYGLRRVDAATAHDVAAEVFAVAWRRLERPPEPARPWLFAVARRVLANELRRQGRREQLHLRLAAEPQPPGAPADAGIGADEDATRLAEALSRLSGGDRELLRLVAWDGLDPVEAAAVLGCSTSTLRVRLHRARRRLRAALASQPTPSNGRSR